MFDPKGPVRINYIIKVQHIKGMCSLAVIELHMVGYLARGKKLKEEGAEIYLVHT